MGFPLCMLQRPTNGRNIPTAMCKYFNSYIFYAEDLNLQILNKVRRWHGYKKPCVCLWQVYLAETTRHIQMKRWVCTRQCEPVAYRLLWTSREWGVPWGLESLRKVSRFLRGLRGWAGFRWAQHVSESAEMSFVPWGAVMSDLLS